MTLDLKAIFEKHEDEFLKFELVAHRLSNRPDLHAFLLLDSIVPPEPTSGIPTRSHNMVASAEHDEIWLHTDLEKLAEFATEGQVVDLIRCGVRLDDEVYSLAMFV